jgi:hypothetical protein
MKALPLSQSPESEREKKTTLNAEFASGPWAVASAFCPSITTNGRHGSLCSMSNFFIFGDTLNAQVVGTSDGAILAEGAMW